MERLLRPLRRSGRLRLPGPDRRPEAVPPGRPRRVRADTALIRAPVRLPRIARSASYASVVPATSRVDPWPSRRWGPRDDRRLPRRAAARRAAWPLRVGERAED